MVDSRRCTFDVESDEVGAVVIGRLGTNLAVVQAVVCRPNVLNDQAPLARSLVVVDSDTRVTDERIQPDGQRVNVVIATPRDLYTMSRDVVMSAESRDKNDNEY